MDGDLHLTLSRFVLEHQREAVVVLDRAGRVVDANQSARGAELDLAALFAGPDLDTRIVAFLDELAASGRAFTLVASSLGSVFRLEGTSIANLNVVVARELARHAGGRSVLGPVAASFIHDFNNLLMPILLFSGRLERELQKGSEAAMIASEIRSSASVAAALARDVLTLARPRVPHVEHIVINDLIASAERMIRRLAGSNVEVLFSLEDETDLMARVDATALTHALFTLVIEARDRMPEGGHLAISTALVDHEGTRRIALTLTDTGNAAADASTSDVDGFSVERRGVDGRGTNATIYLDPAERASLPVAAPPQASEVVMIAERDERLRRAIEGVLRDNGFTVVTATDQRDAVDAAASHAVRVAILDATILRRAPSAFLHELRARAPGLRFVLLTDEACGDLPPSQVTILTKPFGDEALIRAVRLALR